MYDPIYELEHFGVPGMKWGVRRTPAQLGHRKEAKRKKRLSKKVNKLAWKAEKYDREFDKELAEASKRYQETGEKQTISYSYNFMQSIHYMQEARKLIDKMYPEFSNTRMGDLGDIKKQKIYDEIKQSKVPKWAK